MKWKEELMTIRQNSWNRRERTIEKQTKSESLKTPLETLFFVLWQSMKQSICIPDAGCVKLTEMNEEWKLHTVYEKHMTTKVVADALGEEWTGSVVPVSGGNNMQDFPMKQDFLTHGRVCLLSCVVDQGKLNRKYKSVWVFTADANLKVLNGVMWLLF